MSTRKADPCPNATTAVAFARLALSTSNASAMTRRMLRRIAPIASLTQKRVSMFLVGRPRSILTSEQKPTFVAVDMVYDVPAP